ncbi:MAG: response regulator [Planctomycetota bacterium]|jgi:PAS domain S-box-containing protein
MIDVSNNRFALLIVDDEQGSCSVLSALLGSDLPNATVVTAASAEEGLSAAAAVSFDGAIIDVQMPGMDGVEMCQRLKDDPATSDVPVILMTGRSADANLKARGLEAGADDFVEKPVGKVELLARIKVMLRIRRARAAMRAIVEGTAAVTGEELFLALVRHLADILGVRYALVGELASPTHIRTRAAWLDGAFEEDFEYDLAGTPCEQIMLTGSLCLYPQGLQQSFPREHALVKMGIHSYLGAPLLDGEGGPQGVLAVMDGKPMADVPLGRQLVTIFAARASAELSRLRAEEAIRASREMLRSVIDANPDVTIVVDRHYRIVQGNRKARELAGDRPLAEMACYELSHHGDAPCHEADSLCPVKEAIAAKRPIIATHEHFDAQGRKRTMEISAAPIFGPDGNVVRVVQDIRDVTERKQAEQKLAIERAALEQKNIALREVMSTIEDEKKVTSRRIVRNIDEVVMPILHSLQGQAPPAMQELVARAIAGLEEVTSPFIDTLSKQYASLTPAEIRVCDSIRAGMATKEIAKLYGIAAETVNHHRRSIRRKLGIAKSGQNLTSYLQAFLQDRS